MCLPSRGPIASRPDPGLKADRADRPILRRASPGLHPVGRVGLRWAAYDRRRVRLPRALGGSSARDPAPTRRQSRPRRDRPSIRWRLLSLGLQSPCRYRAVPCPLVPGGHAEVPAGGSTGERAPCHPSRSARRSRHHERSRKMAGDQGSGSLRMAPASRLPPAPTVWSPPSFSSLRDGDTDTGLCPSPPGTLSSSLTTLRADHLMPPSKQSAGRKPYRTTRRFASPSGGSETS